jgi:hypothetical protein
MLIRFLATTDLAQALREECPGVSLGVAARIVLMRWLASRRKP